MAAWQIKIEFIPEEWADTNEYDVSKIQSSDGYSTDCAWLENQPSCNFKEILTGVMPNSKSWHKDLLFWGDTSHDDIQLWYENEIVSSICLRIDLRRNPVQIVSKALVAARELRCVWFYPELHAIEIANETSIFHAIVSSSAAKFVGLNEDRLRELWLDR